MGVLLRLLTSVSPARGVAGLREYTEKSSRSAPRNRARKVSAGFHTLSSCGTLPSQVSGLYDSACHTVLTVLTNLLPLAHGVEQIKGKLVTCYVVNLMAGFNFSKLFGNGFI